MYDRIAYNGIPALLDLNLRSKSALVYIAGRIHRASNRCKGKPTPNRNPAQFSFNLNDLSSGIRSP